MNQKLADEALRTFTTGENFHVQHYLGCHQTKNRRVFRSLGTKCAAGAIDWRYDRLARSSRANVTQ